MSDVDISEVVDSSISIEDNFPSREGFTTLMIAAFHQFSLARVLTYGRSGEVDEDFPAGHHVRAAVHAAFSQNPRLRECKVGRRDGAPSQTLRYTPIDTTAGHIYSGSVGGVEWTYTVPTGASVSTICAGITAAIDATSLKLDADAILTSLATSGSEQVIDTEADGVIGLGAISPPRKITVLRSSHANQDAVTAVLLGTDEFGNAQSENLTFADTGGETVTSAKRYASFVSLTIPVQGGTGGTTGIGIAAAVDATDGTTHVDVASVVAGTWFAHQFGTDDGGALTSAQMTVEDRTTNPGTTIETDLSTIAAADDDWIALAIADAQSEAQILDAADWALSNDKAYVADTADSAVASSATTDVGSDLEDTENALTALLYHRNGGGYFPSCRWAGNMLPRPVGTTWALKTLAGLSTDDLTSSERTNLKAKNVNFYVKVGADGRTYGKDGGGKAASGRFLDLSIYSLYTNAGIKLGVFGAITAGDELPMDNGGGAVIKSAITAILAGGERARKLRNVVIVVPDVDDVPIADRAARLFSGIEWDATYIGATHAARIRGRFTV